MIMWISDSTKCDHHRNRLESGSEKPVLWIIGEAAFNMRAVS